MTIPTFTAIPASPNVLDGRQAFISKSKAYYAAIDKLILEIDYAANWYSDRATNIDQQIADANNKLAAINAIMAGAESDASQANLWANSAALSLSIIQDHVALNPRP